MAEESAPRRPDPRGSPAARAGLPVPEYKRRVWDMAKHLVHPAGIYALLQVLGMTRLLAHPLFEEPGAAWGREIALFAAGFLGAWAVLLSTLLRDAGLRSMTVTLLVPLTALGCGAVWFAFPAPDRMDESTLLMACLVLSGAAPIAWVGTVVRWYRARRECAAILAGDAS